MAVSTIERGRMAMATRKQTAEPGAFKAPPWALGLPANDEEIAAIHRRKKRQALERAKRSAFLAPRVSGIDPRKLDDPAEWAKIPVLTKDELRKLSTEEFYRDFCIAGFDRAVEFWRSGGSTGKPLFYPRSAEDMRYMLGVAFRRIWPCIGATAKDTLHVSFPMGIHPVGQLAPRAAEMEGMATVWAGAGTTTPSEIQLELILGLKPTIVAAMPSYALHLANLAEARGIDLAGSSVAKLLVSAEPLTQAKRDKLARAWGAAVYNSFGMTEGAMTSVERHGVGAMVAFTDLYFLEVIDSATGKLVAPGETGALVMTPLWSNTITPFLRWFTGDIVRMAPQKRSKDPFSVFPTLDHALRTEGFFKIRGVNVNHGDLEDFMFAQPAIQDFKGEARTAADGQDHLCLLVELRRGADAGATALGLVAAVKRKFEQTCMVEILPAGTLAQEFEKAVKAPRFTDKR
ncbi:MAG: AMP-binding protein [Rhodospirillaceae bacterium]|nr:AMP-binding protein [Rhodospirillaceae bacterium]